jgi:hypothetical protein
MTDLKKKPANSNQALIDRLEELMLAKVPIKIVTGRAYTEGLIMRIMKGRYKTFIEVSSLRDKNRSSIHPVDISTINFQKIGAES